MRAYHLFDRWLAEARPDRALDLFDVYVAIKPIGKERPRGKHQTPIKTRTWTDHVAACVAEMMENQPTIDFPVSAAIVYGIRKKRLPDMDNIEKAVWDALQRGDKSGNNRAIHDDRYVRRYVERAEKIVESREEEFIWVRFYAQSESDYYSYRNGDLNNGD